MNIYLKLLSLIPVLIIFIWKQEYVATALLMIYWQLHLIYIKLGDKNGTTN